MNRKGPWHRCGSSHDTGKTLSLSTADRWKAAFWCGLSGGARTGEKRKPISIINCSLVRSARVEWTVRHKLQTVLRAIRASALRRRYTLRWKVERRGRVAETEASLLACSNAIEVRVSCDDQSKADKFQKEKTDDRFR